MKILSIIPARGGSKGIVGKNIALLAGKPLIAYMIEAAKQSKYINEIIVSTDSQAIARIAQSCGAKVHPRSVEISGDDARSEDALLDVLTEYDSDILVFLQCTAPFTTTSDIDNTIETMLNENADTALAVTSFHYFLWNKEGEGINHNKARRPLRQEKEQQYLEAGSIYVMRTQEFRQYKHRFFGKTAICVVPPERVLEIDEPLDLELAEYLMQKRGK
jgi:CMP-N-acetylneuraminic acid synthetase